jgi:homoserine kinase
MPATLGPAPATACHCWLRNTGAYGCTISGAGPTAVAVVPDPETGARVAEAMGAAFRSAGGLEVNSSKVVRLDGQGARFV